MLACCMQEMAETEIAVLYAICMSIQCAVTSVLCTGRLVGSEGPGYRDNWLSEKHQRSSPRMAKVWVMFIYYSGRMLSRRIPCIKQKRSQCTKRQPTQHASKCPPPIHHVPHSSYQIFVLCLWRKNGVGYMLVSILRCINSSQPFRIERFFEGLRQSCVHCQTLSLSLIEFGQVYSDMQIYTRSIHWNLHTDL